MTTTPTLDAWTERRALALALDLDLRRLTTSPIRRAVLADAIDHLEPDLNAEGVPQFRYSWHACARSLRELGRELADTREAELWSYAADVIEAHR